MLPQGNSAVSELIIISVTIQAKLQVAPLQKMKVKERHLQKLMSQNQQLPPSTVTG